MIRHTDTSNDSQTKNISSTDGLHQYDHLIPPMKKVLKFTAKATWFMMKTLVKAAFHLPALMRKTTEHMQPKPQPQSVPKSSYKKLPSPESAFPAP